MNFNKFPETNKFNEIVFKEINAYSFRVSGRSLAVGGIYDTIKSAE